MWIKNNAGITPLFHKKDLTDFLCGACNGDGKPKEDTALFVPVRLAFCQNLFCKNKTNDGGIGWTFSTFDLDRFDERVDPLGWELGQYKKNPVVQWAHRFDIPAIGRADNIFVDDGGLHGTVVFNAKEFDAFGWGIGERVKAGVLRAGSVGFRVLEIEFPDRETAADGTGLIFRRQELLEFSVCNVPANPFALSRVNSFLPSSQSGKNEKLNPSDFFGGLIK
jgi:HK97 family phage prohead protease